MIVNKIFYSSSYLKAVKKLPPLILALAQNKESLFRDNPLHPSLRLHQLHGPLKNLWSISLTSQYRIIFERQANGDLLFISVGRHDIYKHL